MSVSTTDDVYNASSRQLEQKVIIYFPNIEPLIITRDDYLISSSILEEAHAQNGSTPFGTITSNEVTIDLLNTNGIFSPTNLTSPYYGLMKKSIKIEIAIRPVSTEEQYEWDPLGTYYITDWRAKVTGLIATITANDKLYDTFKKDLTTAPICQNITQKEFYEYIFDKLGIQGDIDSTLNNLLNYAYINKSTKEVLTTLNFSSLADCFCLHDGSVKVLDLLHLGDVRAVITDADQIIEADIEQSLLFDYDGVNLTYNLPQESDIKNVLSLKECIIPRGISSRNNIKLTGTPLLRLYYALMTNTPAHITKLEATPTSINITTQNLQEDNIDCTIDIFGTTLVNNEITIGLETENPLSISNIYIQDTDYARRVYDHLKAYVNNLLPVLSLTVRGNPKLELGDVIQANSERYNLSYTGVLIKQTFDYEGSLSSTITLLNIDILKEV